MGMQQKQNLFLIRTEDNSNRSSASLSSSRWLTRFLEAKTFLKLPAKNLQALISHLREIKLSRGETVTHVGDAADHYYIVKQGSLDIYHAQQIIATLHEGDGFGEELLGEQGEYLFDITAHNDCVVMKLPKAHFISLLATPTIDTITHQERAGTETILDINESPSSTVHGALHIPFSHLRNRLNELDKKARYIVMHNDNGLRFASAFSLGQLGYQALALDGELPPPSSDVIQEDNIALDITKLEGQLKSIESLIIEDKAEEIVIAPPRNTSIVCVERDDEKLWTPIFSSTSTHQEHAHKKATPVTSSNTSNWLDDNYVWEKVLGFDSTHEVEELIIQEEAETKHLLRTSFDAPQARNTNPFLPAPIIPLPAPQPAPVDTKAQLNKSQNNIAARKQRKTWLYTITLVLALVIATAPFVMPNTWNKLASPLFDYVEQHHLIPAINPAAP